MVNADHSVRDGLKGVKERNIRRNWWNSLSFYSASVMVKLQVVVCFCCAVSKKARLLERADEQVESHLDVAR